MPQREGERWASEREGADRCCPACLRYGKYHYNRELGCWTCGWCGRSFLDPRANRYRDELEEHWVRTEARDKPVRQNKTISRKISLGRWFLAFVGVFFLAGGIIYFPAFAEFLQHIGIKNKAFVSSIELPLEVFGGFLILLSLFARRRARAVKVAVLLLLLLLSVLFVWHTPGLKAQVSDIINNWRQRLPVISQSAKPTTPTPSTRLTLTPTPQMGALPTLTPAQTLTPSPTAAVTRTPTPGLATATTPGLPELAQYLLDLINRDRQANGLPRVTLGTNTAALKHAEEMADNGYISHWGLDGMKPYMRYTLAGGSNYEAENTYYSTYGYTIWSISGIPVRKEVNKGDPREDVAQAEKGWMASPGHRRNILDKWHKKVNLGLAWGKQGFAAVQQFEGDYIEFNRLPTISEGALKMAGKVTLGKVDSVAIYYDPLPQPLTRQQLEAPPYDYSYSLGERVGSIIPPPPPGYFYTELPSDSIQASRWDVSPDGSFIIETNIGSLLEQGKGVYTIVIWAKIGDESVNLTNYSIFAQ